MAQAAVREDAYQRETGRVTDALIAEMVEILVEEADPEQIILFGSRGRGEARDDSDVDLIVVEAEPFGRGRDRVKEMARLYRALARLLVLSPCVLAGSRGVLPQLLEPRPGQSAP